MPEVLESLDLSRNNIDNPGVTAIVKAIEQGHLPNLNYIDLSENKDARNKWDLFDALKLRSERELEAIKLQAASEGRGTPMGVTLRRFTLEAGKEFKVVPINPVRSIDDDD